MTLISCAAIILVFTLPPYILACYGYYYYYEYTTTTTSTTVTPIYRPIQINRTKYKDPVMGNKNRMGWTLSPNEEKKWQDWFDKYQSEHNESNFINPNNLKEFDEERGPGSGWPHRWADVGTGFRGDEPPPWAYEPKNTGKPSYCFLPPMTGVCVPPEGLDPAKYTTPAPSLSGCSGNRNNFQDRQKCEQRCVAHVPFNGCDVESHIYVDDLFGGGG